MVVVIASKIPPSVRGRLKLWFIEPRANVFVSGVKDSVADRVVQELWETCNVSTGIMVIKSRRGGVGYIVETRGEIDRCVYHESGFFLVSDKM